MAKNNQKQTKAVPKTWTLASQFYGVTPILTTPDNKRIHGKPGIPYGSLRNLSRNNDTVRIVIDRMKHRVSKTPYIIRTKDPKETTKVDDCIKYLESLLDRPNINANDSFRSLMSKLVEDILVVDNGVIEKVKNAKGEIAELYTVDGTTIYPNYDEYGLQAEPAFYQYFDADPKPAAELERDDLLIFQMNPRSDIMGLGFGSSPVENVISTVLTSLQAAIYNADYFDSAKLPPFMANLKGVPTEELVKFKEAFETQLKRGYWSSPFTNAEDFTLQSLRPSNQDMQFMELNMWLARIICAEFELSPQEIGLTMEINRSTANTQQQITSEGVENLLAVIAEEINLDLINWLAENVDKRFGLLEMAWDIELKVDDLKRAQTDQILIQSGLRTVDELRSRDGLDPFEQKPKTLDEILANHTINNE